MWFRLFFFVFFFFFKQKTAYELLISDWSSDVCSSDLTRPSGRDIGASPGLRAVSHPGVEQQPVLGRSLERPHLGAGGRSADRARSEERRGGNELVSTCRSRWSPYH